MGKRRNSARQKTPKRPPLERITERIEKRRRQGRPAAEIGEYARTVCIHFHLDPNRLALTGPERAALEQIERDIAERQEKRRAAATEAEARLAEWRASLPPPPPPPANLKREGMSPTEAKALLGCSATELNRWADDGRLPPDGIRYYRLYDEGVNGRWGRAWLPETVRSAQAHIDDWRARDAAMVGPVWASEASLFVLVQSRFPDAVRQWSPQWLGRQSVDAYVPSINVAFEYQGEQHYRPVALFGGDEGFRATQARDARKRDRLALHGVALVEWRFDTAIVDAELDRALACIDLPASP